LGKPEQAVFSFPINRLAVKNGKAALQTQSGLVRRKNHEKDQCFSREFRFRLEQSFFKHPHAKILPKESSPLRKQAVHRSMVFPTSASPLQPAKAEADLLL
jgi:hypothetical protein